MVRTNGTSVVDSKPLGDLGDKKVKAKENQENSLLHQDELEAFDSMYPEIVKLLIEKADELMPDMEYATDHMKKVMDYNVCGGKKIRGLMVPITYKSLVPDPTPENLKLAYILGWILEMLQGASLIADDIMDESSTRRGKPCWYKVKDVGMTAVNDCLLLEILSYQILTIYFEDNPCYFDLNHTIHDIINKSIYGQGLDCLTGRSKNIVESFTMERYSTIVKYKTSYYTMYLPVALAMILAGKHNNLESMKIVEEIMLEVGHYFQVQDDYLDCFGDEKITGKVGTDIQDNKCSWLFVQAVQKCSPEQLEYLLANYGVDDPVKVEKVKELYRDLELDDAFADYEKEAQEIISKKIQQLPDDIPEDVFRQLFLKIYQRRK